jgi:uncharacterized protein YdeI (YjbR/CyaY-like superfamily)
MKTEVINGGKKVVNTVIRFFTPLSPVEKWVKKQNQARAAKAAMEADFASRIKEIEGLEAQIVFLQERLRALAQGAGDGIRNKAYINAQLELGVDLHKKSKALEAAKAAFNNLYPGHIFKM